MTHNADQAKSDRQALHDWHIQHEMRAILRMDGRQFCCNVAQKMGMKVTETRWHLEEMRKRGEVDYKMGSYGV